MGENPRWHRSSQPKGNTVCKTFLSFPHILVLVTWATIDIHFNTYLQQILSIMWEFSYLFYPADSKYSVQRTTSNLGVSYYVKQDFDTDYQGSIRRLEQHVEEDYVSTLRNACFKEKNYSMYFPVSFSYIGFCIYSNLPFLDICYSILC